MKFPTQHVKRKGKKFIVHRDKNVTWHTSGANNSITDKIVHDTVAQAKAYLRDYNA